MTIRNTEIEIAYICFDVFPSSKGAATHIEAFANGLAQEFKKIYLITVAPNNTFINESINLINGDKYSIINVQLPAIGETLIHRIIYFRRRLMEWFKDKYFNIIHIRSPFEGFPIALNKNKYCKKFIFEVNGLPSIELKYRYPAVIDDKELMHKLYQQEKICLENADLIITPSEVTASFLQTRNVFANKIRIIPNGVNTDIFTYDKSIQTLQTLNQNPSLNDVYEYKLIYFGTLSSWQGVNLAIEALALMNRDIPAKLKIIGHAKNYQTKSLQKLASKLKISEKITILNGVSQTQLVEHIHSSDVVLAPLTASDRNMIQGCCPLKVIEAMAAGVPVVASDLPVVSCLGENEKHFLLVKPGSTKSIKDAVIRLYQDQDLSYRLAINARQQIESKYTWDIALEALISAYKQLI